MSATKELLVVGLPEAGKTSFIQAVDELLQDPPDSRALRSYQLASDRTALEKVKDRYRGGRPVGRTERHPHSAAPELFFEDPSSGTRGHLILPDFDGEIFTDQWKLRACERAYKDRVCDVDGLLVFVRADLPSRNEELLGDLIKQVEGQPQEVRSWDPKHASAQVQLVEVLQWISEFRARKAPLRSAVIISAWDVVAPPAYPKPPNPDRFLATDWALLDQFLQTNPESFVRRVYGVSALGGNLPAQAALAKLPPRQRVRIADGDDSGRDVTRPLRWLLQLD